MYAIVSDRGHQYKVREGDLVRVDRLDLEEGAPVIFREVLLLDQDGDIRIGNPCLEGVQVSGVHEGHAKGKKLIAIRRVKTNRHKTRRGHRTQYSMVKIQKIEA